MLCNHLSIFITYKVFLRSFCNGRIRVYKNKINNINVNIIIKKKSQKYSEENSKRKVYKTKQNECINQLTGSMEMSFNRFVSTHL